MLGTPFYHETIRKLTVAIGTLFNDVHVLQKDAVGTLIKDIKVPLAFAPRTGYWSKLRDDVGGMTEDWVQKTLPRMSFDFEGPVYDPTRQLNTTQKINMPSATGSTLRTQMYQPIPYNFMFNLSVYSNRVEDGLQMMEQILPYFAPSYNLVIKMIDENGALVTQDVPISISNVVKDDNYQDGFVKNRLISWSFDIVAKGYIYHRTVDSKPIKTAIVNMYNDPSMTNLLEDINVQVDPLAANKEDIWTPVTVITIDPSQLG